MVRRINSLEDIVATEASERQRSDVHSFAGVDPHLGRLDVPSRRSLVGASRRI